MLLTECIESCLDATCPFFGDDALIVDALAFMQKGGYECLPVLHEGKFTAMVTLLDLLLAEQFNTIKGASLGELKLEKAESIGLHEHLFNIFSRISTFSSFIIAVSDEDGRYVGVIEKVILLERIAAIFHLDHALRQTCRRARRRLRSRHNNQHHPSGGVWLGRAGACAGYCEGIYSNLSCSKSG